MTLGDIVAIVSAVGGVLVTAGVTYAQLVQARASIADQGRRLGAVEKWQAYEDGRRIGAEDVKDGST